MITNNELQSLVTLYRPTGPNELALVAQSGYTKWPPRLPEQPIFYPVTNEAYAAQIAKEWNVPASGSGYVTRFYVKNHSWIATQFSVGGEIHTEWWIPAEEHEEMNANIVGLIKSLLNFIRNRAHHETSCPQLTRKRFI